MPATAPELLTDLYTRDETAWLDTMADLIARGDVSELDFENLREYLTDMAIRAESIDEAKAEEARRRAEARLAEKLDDEEAAMVSAALAHSLAQLKVKRRQR